MTTAPPRRRSADNVRRRRRRKQVVKKSLWQRLNDSDIFSKKKPKKTEVVAFTRELATLLDSGIGMGPALLMLGEQRKNSMLGEAILSMAEDLNSGLTIAESMTKHPDVFPKIYVRTVSAADRGAPLATSLRQAADFMDTAASAIAQAKRALVYPALILTVGIGVVIMLLTISLAADDLAVRQPGDGTAGSNEDPDRAVRLPCVVIRCSLLAVLCWPSLQGLSSLESTDPRQAAHASRPCWMFRYSTVWSCPVTWRERPARSPRSLRWVCRFQMRLT